MGLSEEKHEGLGTLEGLSGKQYGERSQKIENADGTVRIEAWRDPLTRRIKVKRMVKRR